MAGKTVLVTGGTSGIGKATAEGCARLGARVGIAGRDRRRAESAASGIKDSTGGTVDVFVADLSSLAEVRRLAGEVLDAYPRLDVLVNNAGGTWATRHATADGLERTFAVNHLAPFLLTWLLLDRLKASAPSRIVTVASAMESMAKIDFDDLQGTARYGATRAYNQSKLANIMFTYELARRIAGSGVTATVLHPGVVRTSLGTGDMPAVNKLASIGRPLMKSPEQGAATSVYLACSPEAEGITGAYFVGCKARESSKRSRDPDAARRLWQASARLAGLGDQ
jgi:NAD(P)-dependent dehydrogenase (short-subunit alcohol dehydrogenase family)